MDATSLPSNPKHNALAVQANVIEELTSQVEKLRKLAIEKEIDYADKLQQKNDQIEDIDSSSTFHKNCIVSLLQPSPDVICLFKDLCLSRYQLSIESRDVSCSSWTHQLG